MGKKQFLLSEVIDFLEKLDIKKFFGVGKVTVQKMYRHGIFTGKDLKEKSNEYLDEHFGKSGRFYYQRCKRQSF